MDNQLSDLQEWLSLTQKKRLQGLVWNLRDRQILLQGELRKSPVSTISESVEETAELWGELWGAPRDEAK